MIVAVAAAVMGLIGYVSLAETLLADALLVHDFDPATSSFDVVVEPWAPVETTSVDVAPSAERRNGIVNRFALRRWFFVQEREIGGIKISPAQVSATWLSVDASIAALIVAILSAVWLRGWMWIHARLTLATVLSAQREAGQS